MITVNGVKSDYAIMKQVQQLMLAGPHRIVPLDDTTDFSGLGATEKLYIASHGNAADGNLRDIVLPTLARSLSDAKLGLPQNFGGIVLLSCYSGQKMGGWSTSLAARLAVKLQGRVAAGTTVIGACGYSFGTPEFRKSGQSSVVPLALASFYFADSADSMKREWLTHKPTHTGGVLRTLFNSDTDTAKTIEVNIKEKLGQQQSRQSVDDVVRPAVTAYAKQAKAIEKKLGEIIARVPGNTVAERADHLLTQHTQDAAEWNAAIDKQYALFEDHYLWTPSATAFAGGTV